MGIKHNRRCLRWFCSDSSDWLRVSKSCPMLAELLEYDKLRGENYQDLNYAYLDMCDAERYIWAADIMGTPIPEEYSPGYNPVWGMERL